MTSLFMKTLRREETKRRPLWIMRQAGRYLPEYRALREKHSFEDLCARPDLATEVTLMPFKRFAFDAAIIFADIMSPIAALNVDFRFAPGPIVAKPLRDQKAIDSLPEPDAQEIAPEVITTIKSARSSLSQEIALLGFAGAPWTLAAYLIEGEGRREFPTLRAFAFQEPELLDRLLGKLSRLVSSYLIEQHRAGVQAIQLFDSWAGLLSLPQWEKTVRPHLLSIFEQLRAAQVPSILFLQNAPHLVEAYASLPIDAIAVDWRVDLRSLYHQVSGRMSVQGNLEPTLMLTSPALIREQTKRLVESVPRRGHIVNLGHGILPKTPLENVAALVDAVQEFS